MMMAKAKMGLFLLLALSLPAGAGLPAYPLRSDKRAEEKPATAPKPQEGKNESPKPARDDKTPTDLYGDPLPAGAIARLGTVRFRHGGDLRDVVVSPDGRTLISAGGNSVETWDAQTGRRLRRFTFAGPLVWGINLSPDGKILAVNQLGRTKMRFWDFAGGAEIHPFGDAAPAAVQAAFSPQGDLLATLEFQGKSTVGIWDVRQGKKIRTLEGAEALKNGGHCLTFSPKGNLLAFPRASGFGVWDLAAGKELYQLNLGSPERPGCASFSSDGKLLAAARYQVPLNPESVIHLWDMATGKEVGALKGPEERITALAVSPKSNVLASASLDGTLRFWDLTTRRESSRHPCSGSTNTLVFHRDGRVLIVGEGNGAMHRWRVGNGREDRTPAEQANELIWAAFAPDGQTLISVGEGRIGLWEPLTGRPRQFLDANPVLYATYKALSPDGKLLATSDWRKGQIVLSDVATGKLVRRLGEGGQRGLIFCCIFSPDGSRVAGGSIVQDIVRVWDTASGKELLQLKGQSNTQALAFAPDGATLAAANGRFNTDLTVRLWKLATGEEVWRKTTNPWLASDLKFSPDGRTLALGGGLPSQRNSPGEIRLWEAATGKELRRFEGHHERAVLCVAFSPDGRMLASGSDDNTIRLWEVATGGERRCLQGHQKGISSVSFSPDGSLLVSSSLDTTALVWDLTGRFRDGRFPTQRLSAAELDRCWTDLAHADAVRAYRSIVALTGSPKDTVAFLKDHLQPLTPADPQRVRPLLAALDSDRFAERDKAMTELEKLGLAVEPALRKALAEKPPLEVRRRIEELLANVADGPRWRFVRALEILEHLATAEARRLLEALSQGTAEMWPTQEAKAALARLAARPGPKP